MKNRDKVNGDKRNTNRKHQALSALSVAVLASMSQSAQSSDLEIYQAPEEGKVVLTMMLDNSGSMDATDNSSCTNANRFEEIEQKIYDNNGVYTGEIKKYWVNYCSTQTKIEGQWYETGRYYDRLSRVKMALIPMFANPKSNVGFGTDFDVNKYKIGLGSFEAGGNTKSEGRGKIDIEAKFLNFAHRKDLITKIIGYGATTNTPLANAYAAAGAYMLGTSTDTLVNDNVNSDDIYNLVAVTYKKRDGSSQNFKYFLYKCNSDYNTQSIKNVDNYNYHRCGSYAESSKNKSPVGMAGVDYTKSLSVNSADSLDSDLKTSQNGKSQIEEITFYFKEKAVVPPSTSPIIPGQCNAQGIYFLTDGEPNQSRESDTLNLMNNSLGKTPLAMSTSCDSTLSNSDARYGGYSGWECMGEYAPLLNSSSNYQKAAIETATVGFGSVYKELSTIPKIEKTITKPNGETKVVSVYNCDSEDILSQDAKNLCRLGEKGYGLGQGGFYYTETSRDVSDSVKSFVKSLGDNVISPISTGTMSVPLDNLSGLKSRGFAYLPILEPVPGSSLLWNGNLKKYKTRNATLIGDDDNYVFQDQKGTFATNTHDLWNTIIDDTRPDAKRPDAAKPQVGGAYQKVFENANGTGVGDRNLFVDNGGTLVKLTVSASKVPNNFDALTTLSDDGNEKKPALLNFMGYSVSKGTTVKDGEALNVDKQKEAKNIGGVLHSIPQLITQKVNISGSGEFDRASRKDYILYGSMDGALHMIDDSTGKETFTFIPQQIVDLQPAAIAGEGAAIDGSYPYGVDAPWMTYAAYTIKENTTGTGASATTTNTYEASQSFALGGLRMGGSTYYALDVTSPTAPKLIFSVGSNYANRQKGLTTDIRGIKNGTSNIISTSGATNEQKAYARMGQTWGKPELGYVKSGGKRVMVSFLPGGYDACYENTQFKLGNNANSESCADKSKAQGNAMYMVQVGEIKKNSNNEEQVETGSDSGKLLWWASSDATGSNSTNRSNFLQQSQVPDIKHSIVTQVRALDRNYDGLTDHIYFADLGGQVWRADINNNADTDNFKIDRVVKVLDVSDQATGTTDTDTDAPPRIYERPLVTFHNGIHRYTDADNNSVQYSGIEALVTVGTGDRSNPVTATRNKPNAIYSILDKDVARTDLFYYGTGTAPTISMRTPVIRVADTMLPNNKLQELTFTDEDIGDTGIKKRMQTNVVQGWYMPLTHWLGEEEKVDGKYKLKMFNEPDAIAGILITSSFNPDEGDDVNSCSAGVIGETQRERTCLPYGVCFDKDQNEVVTTRSSYSAGLGIVDNIISQYNDGTLFTSLKNRCEGDECIPKEICTGPDCDDDQTCVGDTCAADDAINVDKRINPLSWMER
ncbi:PilC/PilY family type IV pilus protein [Psychrobacter sp. Marseille-P5312]|uniref:PilC/PilY family type IV pilus protein n=1 Tax=Psychrobacter sp. Marseille-P5312 TaxID=2086574 RepID=UPI000CF63758|nr:PilC/PilY family type IV pilus protein [Psychrobacter sp. Marseille-P5312]